MPFAQDSQGRYIIPDDFTGNLDMVKAGYPKDSVFIKNKDIVPEEPENKGGDAGAGGGAAEELLKQQADDKGGGAQVPSIFEKPEIKELGITDEAKLVEYLVTQRSTMKELEQKANANPFVNFDVDDESIKELMLSKENPETYKAYMKIKHGNMGDMDVLVMKAIKDNPDVFESEDLARSFVEEQYGLVPLIEINEDADEDDIAKINAENAKIKRKNEVIGAKIKIDAKKAKEEMQGVVNKYQIPAKKTREEVEAEVATYIGKWKPVFAEKIATDKEIEIAGDMKFEMNEKALLTYRKAAAIYIQDYMPELNEDSIAKAKVFASNAVFMEFRNEIVKAIGDNVRKMADKEWEDYISKKMFNSSSLKSGEHKEQNPNAKKDGVSNYMADLHSRRK